VYVTQAHSCLITSTSHENIRSTGADVAAIWMSTAGNSATLVSTLGYCGTIVNVVHNLVRLHSSGV